MKINCMAALGKAVTNGERDAILEVYIAACGNVTFLNRAASKAS